MKPSLLGYDYHDGQNGNKEGEFVNNKTQWETTYSDDPKKYFSLSEKGNKLLNEQKKLDKPFFFYKYPITLFIQIL